MKNMHKNTKKNKKKYCNYIFCCANILIIKNAVLYPKNFFLNVYTFFMENMKNVRKKILQLYFLL